DGVAVAVDVAAAAGVASAGVGVGVGVTWFVLRDGVADRAQAAARPMIPHGGGGTLGRRWPDPGTAGILPAR
ncbi:MAG: hypothetical protein DYG90_12830, partial [Chloroflexi bacterium CFX6]|nr:hypothetical protein [Chloroflexi bacterium CFX6]